MKKLVIEISQGDGCTWSCTTYTPFEYESKEKAEELLYNTLLDVICNNPWCIPQSFQFLGFELYTENFVDPTTKEIFDTIFEIIFELDEWFEKRKIHIAY